jgi:hypothetical protein
MMRRALALLALGLLCRLAHAGAPLELVASIPLPHVAGRIDHMALDASGRRLFVAALGNGTLEVIDLARERVERSVPGFAEPQGLALAPESNRLYLAEGGAGRVDALDARSLAVLARIGGLPDADNMRYDAATRTVLAGYGEGAIRLIDADSGRPEGDIPLPGHPEAFELEPGGARLFVNVPEARQVAVVERASRRAVAAWSIAGARANFPLALDAEGRRLFVGARGPAEMLALDIDSGRVVARVPIGRDADDIFFDPGRRRVYVVCGEGRVDVFGQRSPDRYLREASVKTAPRARTGLLAPGGGRLYVAAPALGATPARVLVYRVR